MPAPQDRVSELLQALALCLCSQIKVDGSPSPCYCDVMPGEAAVIDYAGACEEGNGVGWVRMANLYPAAGVGVPNERPGNCASEIGLDIEIGILRRYPLPEDDGTPPDPEEVRAVAALTARDAMTMWRAVACCSPLLSTEYRMVSYQPSGPLGDLSGGTWSLEVVL